MITKAILGAAIAGFALFVTADPPADTGQPGRRLAPMAEDCRPFGDLAAAAFDAAARGTTAQAATILATQQVSEPHIGRMVRGAVRIGFSSPSAADARSRAVLDCLVGLLGR